MYRKTTYSAPIVLVLLTLLSPTVFANVIHDIEISSQSILVKSTWSGPCDLDTNTIAPRYYTALAKAFQFTRLETIPAEGTDAIFIQSVYPHIPEALLQFKKNKPPCTGKCKQAIAFSLQPTIKLYGEMDDLALNQAGLTDIKLTSRISTILSTCVVESAMTFDSLFFFKWLRRAERILKLTDNPSVHDSLLYLSRRLVALATTLHAQSL